MPKSGGVNILGSASTVRLSLRLVSRLVFRRYMIPEFLLSLKLDIALRCVASIDRLVSQLANLAFGGGVLGCMGHSCGV